MKEFADMTKTNPADGDAQRSMKIFQMAVGSCTIFCANLVGVVVHTRPKRKQKGSANYCHPKIFILAINQYHKVHNCVNAIRTGNGNKSCLPQQVRYFASRTLALSYTLLHFVQLISQCH